MVLGMSENVRGGHLSWIMKGLNDRKREIIPSNEMTWGKYEGRTHLLTLIRAVLILLHFIKSNAGTRKGLWDNSPPIKMNIASLSAKNLHLPY